MTFKVNATVVDLRKDTPKVTDNFFIDTNVWYWLGYPKDPDARRYQITNYPSYVNTAFNVGCKLYKCTLSFSELAHSIERCELKLFNKTNNPAVSLKDFRHNYPQQRVIVLNEIINTWDLAEGMTTGNTIEVNVTDNLVNDSLTRLKNQALDGYDAFMIEAMFASGITQVITDDRDFGQVSGITVFTANTTLITEATAQNRLIQR